MANEPQAPTELYEGMPAGNVDEGAAPAAPPLKADPLYKGMTGHINTTEEWALYTKNLEDEVIKAKAQREPAPNLMPQAPQPPPPPTQTEEIEDLWFSNPKEAKRRLMEEIRKENNQEKQKEKELSKFWTEFYEENPDLKNLERVVQSVVTQKAAELNSAPLARAKEILAKETRDVVGLVKRNLGVKETEVPSGSAVTFGASGERPPATPKVERQPVSFASQISKLRKRK